MRILLISILALSLSACVSQDKADLKMAKGCAAGIDALLSDQGKNILEIKSKNYSSEDTEGGLHRRVTIDAIEKDGWVELDKQYSCLFMQEWSLFQIGHKALLVQIKVDDTLYGKKDGTILGSFDDFLRLTKAVDGAMTQ